MPRQTSQLLLVLVAKFVSIKLEVSVNEWVVAVLTANPVESFVVVNVLVSLMDRKCCAGGMGGDRVSFDLPPSIAVVVAFA